MKLPIALLVALAAALTAAGAEYPSPPKTIPELRQRIEKVLAATKTPGAGIAIVDRDGPILVAGIGMADVAQHRPATEDTLFPIGSISKSFVALSVLKLQQEGRLDLQDTLRSRAPEVKFMNPWEATHPVRIVNLLEHTAGWDDNTPQEGELNFMPESTRAEILADYSRSRTSRWQPGTCFSYTNVGPAVAAYVVEKTVGERFEDYVERTWFKPLGMTGAAYFDTPELNSKVSMGYGPAGEAVPFQTFNALLRPAGGIVASARDMANYVEFYINRGSFRGAKLLPSAAIDRMELPTSTYAATEGLEIGYGLNNAATVRGHRIYHGHGGAVPSGLAELTYLPDKGVGYAVMINGRSGDAQAQIGRIIRAYLLGNLKPLPPLPTGVVNAPQMDGYSGWYEPITPRNESSRYLQRILGLDHLTFRNGQLSLRNLGGSSAWVWVGGGLYRRPNDVAPTLALIRDSSEGTLFQFGGGPTFRRLPTFVAASELGFGLATALLMLSSLVFSFAWIPKWLNGKLRDAPIPDLRVFTFLATLSATAVFVLIWEASGDAYARAGGQIWSGTFESIVYNSAHGLFLYFAIAGLARVLNHRRSVIPRLVWWHSFATTFALSIWAVYLTYWGLHATFAIG